MIEVSPIDCWRPALHLLLHLNASLPSLSLYNHHLFPASVCALHHTCVQSFCAHLLHEDWLRCSTLPVWASELIWNTTPAPLWQFAGNLILLQHCSKVTLSPPTIVAEDMKILCIFWLHVIHLGCCEHVISHTHTHILVLLVKMHVLVLTHTFVHPTWYKC